MCRSNLPLLCPTTQTHAPHGAEPHCFWSDPRFGFVEFDDNRDADDAVYELNGRDLCGERVVVEYARGSRRDLDGGGRSKCCRLDLSQVPLLGGGGGHVDRTQTCYALLFNLIRVTLNYLCRALWFLPTLAS